MATTPNYWLQNPTGQNFYDGSSFALNPYQYANEQGTQFAAENLSRLLGGGQPQVFNVQPTTGPYSMPGQATFGGQAQALDGTMLGGMNAGQIAQLYSRYPKHVADEMIAAELRQQSGGLLNPTVQQPGQTPAQAPISPAATQALSSSQNAAGGAQRTTGGGSAPFGSPSGSGAIWSAGTGGSPAVLGGGQQRVNPFAGLFGGGGVGGGVQPPAVSSSGGGQTQPPGVPSSGGQNPYTLPRESPYTPGYNIPQTPRQSSTFGGNVPGAGQFMYNPTTQGIGGNPVLAMLQNVLGLRSSMNRPALNLGAAQRPPNMQNILGSNYQTTRTPAGYTRWQQGG